MSHVFISYSRADSHFARVLKFELEKENIIVWTDTEGLLVGDDWRQGIDEAIQNSYALIVIKSPDSFLSQYVTYEWAYALGIGLTVIPILIKPTQFHPRLNTIQHLDFTNSDPNLQPWKSLIERLKRLDSDIKSFQIQVPRNTPSAIKKLIEALDSPNPTDRGTALGSMSRVNHPLVPEIFAQALHHPYRDVREISAFFLAELFEDKRSAVMIKEMLDGENVRARTSAAEVAHKVWNADILAALISCLSDTRVGQRFNRKRVSVAKIAAEALSNIGTPEALAAVDQYVRANLR